RTLPLCASGCRAILLSASTGGTRNVYGPGSRPHRHQPCAAPGGTTFFPPIRVPALAFVWCWCVLLLAAIVLDLGLFCASTRWRSTSISLLESPTPTALAEPRFSSWGAVWCRPAAHDPQAKRETGRRTPVSVFFQHYPAGPTAFGKPK